MAPQYDALLEAAELRNRNAELWSALEHLLMKGDDLAAIASASVESIDPSIVSAFEAALELAREVLARE